MSVKSVFKNMLYFRTPFNTLYEVIVVQYMGGSLFITKRVYFDCGANNEALIKAFAYICCS